MAINGISNVNSGAGVQTTTKTVVSNNNQSDSIFGFRSTPEELDKYIKENGLFADSSVKKQEKAKPAPKKTETKKQQQTKSKTNTAKNTSTTNKTSSTKSSNNPFVTTSAQLDAHIKNGLFGNGPLEKPTNAQIAKEPAAKSSTTPATKKTAKNTANTAKNSKGSNKKVRRSKSGARVVTKQEFQAQKLKTLAYPTPVS